MTLNVLAFLYEIATGGLGVLSGDISSRVLIDDGALIPTYVLAGHQWWRILTSAFLHGSIIHIGVNMISLWVLGRFIESAMGSVRMAIVYAVSLVAAGLGAVYFSPPDTATLGASGAIFGLFGALFAIGFKLGKPGMELVKANLGILALNLVLTFSIPEISKQEHVAGLLCGFALTLVVFWPPKPVRTRAIDARSGDEFESHVEP